MPTKSILDSSSLYDRYRVAIAIRERIDGGTPKDPKLIEAWVKARTGHDDAETQKQIEEHMPDVTAASDEVAEGMWTTFKRNKIGIYVETRQVKAMLRECAVVLGITKKKRGSRQIIQHGFEVRGRDGGSKIYLEGRDGEDLEIFDEEKAIHVMTAQGPRSAIKRTDYATNAVLEFEIWVLTTKTQETRHLGAKDIETMLSLAQEDGLGANRSQGSGKFDVTRFEPL